MLNQFTPSRKRWKSAVGVVAPREDQSQRLQIRGSQKVVHDELAAIVGDVVERLGKHLALV